MYSSCLGSHAQLITGTYYKVRYVFRCLPGFPYSLLVPPCHPSHPLRIIILHIAMRLPGNLSHCPSSNAILSS